MSPKKSKLATALRLAETDKRLAQVAAAQAASNLRRAEEGGRATAAYSAAMYTELQSNPGRNGLALGAGLSRGATEAANAFINERAEELQEAVEALHEKQVWMNAIGKLMEKRRREALYRESRRETAELVESAVRRMTRTDDLRS